MVFDEQIRSKVVFTGTKISKLIMFIKYNYYYTDVVSSLINEIEKVQRHATKLYIKIISNGAIKQIKSTNFKIYKI